MRQPARLPHQPLLSDQAAAQIVILAARANIVADRLRDRSDTAPRRIRARRHRRHDFRYGAA
jgi:hypothetical protein